MTQTIQLKNPPTRRSQPEPTTRLLRDQEVAERLGVHVATLRAWRRQGYGPPVMRIGRWPRYDQAALASWLAAQQQTLGGPA